jgi:hypothetical protein
MALPTFVVKPGHVQKTHDQIPGAFDLNRYVSWYLQKLNVPIFNACCTADNSDLIQPVAFDGTNIVYFNGTEWVNTGAAIP